MVAAAVTAHAQLRYLERYVDAPAVKLVTKTHPNERTALEVLSSDFGKELEDYRARVQAAVSRLKARVGDIPFDRYALHSGSLSVAMVGDTCVTTLPRRNHERSVLNRGPKASSRRSSQADVLRERRSHASEDML